MELSHWIKTEINIIIIIILSTLVVRSRGLKQKLKTDMLERLEIVLKGCVGKCAKNGDRVADDRWYSKAFSISSSYYYYCYYYFLDPRHI